MILNQLYTSYATIYGQLPCNCVLLQTEEYHTQNGNTEQYLTLHQFKGCDISQLLLSQDASIELTDYYVLLAANHTGVCVCCVFMLLMFNDNCQSMQQCCILHEILMCCHLSDASCV